VIIITEEENFLVEKKFRKTKIKKDATDCLSAVVFNFQNVQLRIQKVHNYWEAVRKYLFLYSPDSMHSYREAVKKHDSTLS